jgi:hypothetical protein
MTPWILHQKAMGVAFQMNLTMKSEKSVFGHTTSSISEAIPKPKLTKQRATTMAR